MAVIPPFAINPMVKVTERAMTTRIATITEVPAATGIGMRCRFINCGIITSPMPTDTIPVSRAPAPVTIAPMPWRGRGYS
jgi:hypothetical protein